MTLIQFRTASALLKIIFRLIRDEKYYLPAHADSPVDRQIGAPCRPNDNLFIAMKLKLSNDQN